ncbi:DeoR/GlpR family DNA-binding transcription regulator [Kineococcus gynurae]|uniref:Lactose phosphotransferase system repressor n=1 Tax=Kineococcus gynurae TaxID=452979 RepID=A0ABV5LW57_9ACTN
MILRAVEREQRSVHELAALTGASTISIRRDLGELADQGMLRRVRGGAAPLARRGTRYPFALRQDDQVETKRRLAAAAAALIGPGDSVVIDNGTTACAVAAALVGRGVTAMALSLHAAAALAGRPGNQVIVPGGPVEPDDLTLQGPGAAEAVRSMTFDVAVVGACAADPGTGLTVATWADAHVKRAVLDSARRVVLVATPEKFMRTAAHRFGALADLDTVITTSELPGDVVHLLRAAGVEVVLVEPES